MKLKPEWQLDVKEKEGFKYRMIKATVGKKLYQCLWRGK